MVGQHRRAPLLVLMADGAFQSAALRLLDCMHPYLVHDVEFKLLPVRGVSGVRSKATNCARVREWSARVERSSAHRSALKLQWMQFSTHEHLA